MLHFSCDYCGKQLDEKRFVAKLSIFPAYDPEKIDEEDLDTDNLQAVADIINKADHDSSKVELESSGKDFRFDLCPDCYSKILSDPLGQERLRRYDFSEN